MKTQIWHHDWNHIKPWFHYLQWCKHYSSFKCANQKEEQKFSCMDKYHDVLWVWWISHTAGSITTGSKAVLTIVMRRTVIILLVFILFDQIVLIIIIVTQSIQYTILRFEINESFFRHVQSWSRNDSDWIYIKWLTKKILTCRHQS